MKGLRATRLVLGQIHLWLGLVLGLFFAVLGLSGSLLVYEDAITRILWPSPAAPGRGAALSLDRIAAIATGAGGDKRLEIALPQRPGDAVVVRVGRMSPMVGPPSRHTSAAGMPAMDGGVELFIDPVTGKVLQARDALEPSVLVFAHQLHGNLLMGPGGRAVVGWLGVAMTAMGLSGVILRWPRRGRWRRALSVRVHAAPWRVYRDLHAVTGVWPLAVFLVVSISGVVIAFPKTFDPMASPAGRGDDGPVIPYARRALETGPQEAVDIARRAYPDGIPRKVTIGGTSGRAAAVHLDIGRPAPVTVFVDPFRATIAKVDRSAGELSRPGIATRLRGLHRGAGLGAWWTILVLCSGLLPALLWATGVSLWLARRSRRQRIAHG
ncbi:MAG TPA: PepSY-associated TM helix domain-containing protein [Caulobacteraceae bacterium]|jgi:uncharacterized iron-regulated membrane protein|nr:PepSY-associated TM helix domain-containing protein [Caulobacteraceae bacterium]